VNPRHVTTGALFFPALAAMLGASVNAQAQEDASTL
jgi:hypothetical protein